MINVNECCDKLDRALTRMIRNKQKQLGVIQILGEKFDIPVALSNDILTKRKKLNNESPFIIYCFCSVIAPEILYDYFTESEISFLSQNKYEVKEISLPLKFKMIQVNPDQWIGTIDTKTLMQLQEANLIHYNERTQRSLKRLLVGGIELFQITLNESAVASIQKLLTDNKFVSNDITLNIPEDSEFFYNPETMELVIKQITAFDITDGYHRLVALSRLYHQDNSFNYNMELRLTCFASEKAKQFIWQNDQKTKMSKDNSATYNQENPANKVVDMLNQPGSVFDGIISANAGKMDVAIFVKCLSTTFFKTKKDNVPRSELVRIRNILKDNLQALLDEDPHVLDEKWSLKQIAAFVYSSYQTDVEFLQAYHATLNHPSMEDISVRKLTSPFMEKFANS